MIKNIISLGLLLFAFKAYAEYEFTVVVIRNFPTVPDVIQKSLSQLGDKWSFPEFKVKDLEEHCGIQGYPYLVTGYFDDDTKIDYAFWAVIWSDNSRKNNLYVFESTTQSLYLLEKSDDIEFFLSPLYVSKKGTKVYDWDTEKYLTLSHDSIGAMTCGKNSRNWVKNDNATYTSIWTGD